MRRHSSNRKALHWHRRPGIAPTVAVWIGFGLAAASLAACSHPRAVPLPPARSLATSPASSPSQATTGTSAAPATCNIREYPNGICPAWLSAEAAAWGSAPEKPFILSPALGSDSYDNPGKPGNTLPVIEEELSMLEDTGAQGITIDMGYDPWLSGNPAVIAKDTAIVDLIRSSGHLVVLKDASAETYRHHPLPWAQFAAAWVARVRTIAAAFHPDYYTVIKEPPWYAPMIAGLSRTASSAADRQVLSVSTWISLLDRLISAVKSVSPNTKVGIAVDGNVYNTASPGDRLDLQLMTAATKVSGLDFLGFDIYTASAFSDTEQFLHRVGTGGKSVWINETWSTTANTDPSLQEQIDPQWANMLIDFAHHIGAAGVSPFFTDYFASYNATPDSAAGRLAFFKGRTPVFEVFRNFEHACRARSPSLSSSAPC